jgi:hypothetical protein
MSKAIGRRGSCASRGSSCEFREPRAARIPCRLGVDEGGVEIEPLPLAEVLQVELLGDLEKLLNGVVEVEGLTLLFLLDSKFLDRVFKALLFLELAFPSSLPASWLSWKCRGKDVSIRASLVR